MNRQRLSLWIASAALVLFVSWNAQLWYWFGTDGVNAPLLLLSAASILGLAVLWAIAARRGDAAPGKPAGSPTLVPWIVTILVAATVGVALDKGFADNTPPYDEPVIAQIGVLVFFLCSLASIVLAAVAAVRAARSRSATAG